MVFIIISPFVEIYEPKYELRIQDGCMSLNVNLIKDLDA